MKANGVASHRTLHVGPIQEAIWRVPNFGPPARDRFERLRLEYEPGYEMLTMVADGDRLTLQLGHDRADALIAAFEDVAIGLGDFGIGTSNDRRADAWVFWWMSPSAMADPRK